MTGGGLNIPNGVNLSNYIITVDSGNINFNGATNTVDNVVLVTTNGNINLGKVQSNNLSVLASGAIDMNGQSRFGGKTLIANGSSNITFNGATKTTTNTDSLTVISQGNITFNGASDTRGDFHSAGSFIANGKSFIYGSIDAKQNIVFNGGAYVTAVITNSAPTNLLLSNSTTPENVLANSLIGNFTSADPDTGNTFTYSLVTGTGSTDNAAFTIVNNELRIISSPNFEAKNSYSIRVRTTDKGGLSFEKTFTINITDLNEAPTALVLSNNVTPENVAANSLLGTFTSADPDTTPQTFTYSLVPGTGSTDNSAFTIVNNELRIVNSPNFEAKSSYSIRVRTTDQGGLSFEKVFTVGVTDVNEAPIALLLSNSTTPENVAANSLIGTFASTDPDTTPQTFTYSLVAGTGSTDNTSFAIINNELRIVNSPNFEAKSSYSIRVRTTDQGGLFFEKVFIVGIADVNEAPTALVLSNNVTPENVAANSLIGTFASTDPDTTPQTFTYSLVTGTGSTDNTSFAIINNELRIVSSPDFEAKSSYSIRVRTTDQGGLAFEKVFTVSITDVNEVKPVGLMLDSSYDSAPIGDSQTTFATVKLVGLAFAYATVTLQSTGTSVTADATGKFAFDNVALNLGDNTFTVTAIDVKGNNGTTTAIVKRVAQGNSNVVLDWNATLLNAIAIDKSAPPIASRNMAIVQTAVFDAINSFTNTYKNYHFAGLAPTGASVEAAAASAAYRTLVNLYPTQTVYFDSALAASLAQIADGPAEDAGVAFGRAVADDILAFRSTDGSSNPATYIPGTNIGDWQPTAPSFATALLPNWGQVTPFGLTSGSQFRPAGDPALTSDQYTAAFNQVKDLGSLNSTTRTADQTEIAKFWADGAGTYTPPGHWNQIAENIVANRGNSLLDNARLFALLDMGLADAGIAAWDAKYTYNSWRPITAIQQADTDGNPNTLADPNWKPLITTPPFPEYVSGHSTFSGTADAILSALLGNNIGFTTNSLGTPGISRTFGNFTDAANEAGISRIYGGIHFNFSNVDGLATGRSVGNYILQNALAPVITLTTLSNNSTLENVPADSPIGAFNTTSESNRFTYSLVAGVGSTDNVAFSIVNNELHIVSSPDFETKNSYSIRVRTTDLDGSYAEKVFTISILDVNENLNPLAIAAQLQQDTGSNSTDTITSNPAITGTITAAGTIVELKAGFGTTASFDILSNYSNGNFTLDANRLNQIAGGTLTDGLQTLKISALDNLGNLNVIDFGFTLDTNAPLLPSFGLDPAFDTSPVGDAQTTAANLTLSGQPEANATVTLLVTGQTTGTTATADATGKFAFANVALNLGANAFTVEAKDIAGNISTFATTVTRAEIPPEVIQLSVKPGEQLKIDAKVVFGKTANFSLFSDSFQDAFRRDLPVSMLQGDGTLTFKPNPGQVGTYEFSLIARDGDTVTTQKFNLNVVADPDTSTRISGAIKNTDGVGLEGVIVTIGNFSVTTEFDGSFILELPFIPPAGTALIIQPGQAVNGIVYPSIAEKLPLLLGHDVYANVDNAIDRPIYLPAIDIANAQTINPAIDQIVTSAAIPSSSVFVAANSLFDREGNPYTEQLSITKVPTALTPAALPTNLRPDLVVTIQPGEMRFATPAPLSLPNLAGYAPGTLMDLWSINPETGLFDKVGVGQVSSNGQVVNTIQGGIRNSSWHFFTPPPAPIDVRFDPRNPDQGCDPCEETAPSNSDVALHSGAEIETHSLVGYQSLGMSRGLTLRYNSERADARPILHFGYTNVPSDANTRLMADLVVKRGDFTLQVPGYAGSQFGLSGGQNFWSTPNSFGKLDAALQADLRELPSGRYEYDLTTGLMRLNSNQLQLSGSSSTTKGNFIHVNTIDSAFGSGWGLGGLQELVENPDGSVLLIDGDGSELIFEKNPDNTYKPKAGVFSTLERLSDGTFRHTTTDKTVYSFNAQNKLVDVKDRMDEETRYIYQNGLLSKMVDPVGLETTFAYIGGKISTITDPAGRVTKLSYDANGNLIKIEDPDGSSQTWEYDAQHHMTAGSDAAGNRGETFYNFAGRVVRSILKDGSEVRFDPIQVQGLYAPNLTNDPLNAPAAFQLGAATSTNIDSRGNQITTTLDNRGQAVSATDAVGNLPSSVRNNNYLITSSISGKGNATTYTYDSRGNVLTSTTSAGTRTYTYESNFNQVTSETDEQGRKTIYDIDSMGMVRSVDRVVGAVGGDDDLITSYTYTARGQSDLVTDPLGRITDYDYDAQGRTIKITVAKGTVDEASQQFEYDIVGNQTASIDELGRRTEYRYDARNRLIETIYPDNTPATLADNPRTKSEFDLMGDQVATVDELGRRTTYVYDKMHHLLKMTAPDPDGAGPLLAPEMRYEYDAGGNQTASIDQLGRRTQYQYDARNRLIATIHADGSRETSIYDADNNLALSTDANGNRTTRQYDNIGRLVRVSDPNGSSTFEYDNTNQLIAQTDANGNRTQYVYDEVGRRIRTIDAMGGITVTSYDKNGDVIAQTDALNHTTTYSYDNRDRQIKTTFAKNTTDEANQKIEYDAAGNQTASIDELGRRTEYRYDARNRLIETIYPDDTPATLVDNARTKSEFDLAGNQVAAIDELGRRTALEYDALNRLVKIVNPDPDGAGSLLSPEMRYEYDAIGNKTAEIDPLGRKTQYQYDNRNRLIAKIYPDGSQETATYDANNNLIATTDANGNVTTRQYDASRRLVKIIEPNGIQTFEYDNNNQLTAQTDANGNRTRYFYDQLGRRYLTIDALGGTVYTSYDKNGNIIAQSDQLNRTTVFSYDNRDRQTTTTTPLGFSSSKVYDAVGNVITEIDANNHATTYRFEARNRQIEAIDALNQSTKTTFDAVGNVIATTNQLNQTSTYRYDNLNRQIEAIDLRNQSSKTEYDAYGNVVAAIDPLGQRTQYGYDLKNRRNTVTDALGKVTTTTYDAFGNVLSITDPENNTTSYGYSIKQTGKKLLITGTLPSISYDGRYVALCLDSSLDIKDTNNLSDIFRLDNQTGELIRVSANQDGDAPNDYSFNTSISGDGRFVAFHSLATNVDGIQSRGLFVRDIDNKITTRVDSPISSNDEELDDFNKGFALSGNGRYIAFVSSESNLVAGDTNGVSDVFVKDLDTGDIDRVSLDSNGNESNLGISAFSTINISEDGRYVAFTSNATNLVGDDTNGVIDIFVRDRLLSTTTRVSVDRDGNEANGKSYYHSMSSDGRFVAFTSEATNLGTGDAAGGGVFIRTMGDGIFNQSRTDFVAQGFAPSIDRTGNIVTFSSFTPLQTQNGGDTPNQLDIYVKDFGPGYTKILSDGISGVFSKISDDGKTVTFSSTAPGTIFDVLVYDLNNEKINSIKNRSGESYPVNRLTSEVNANGAERKYMYDRVGNITSITDRDGTAQAFTYDKLNRRIQEQWMDTLGNITRNITSTYNAAGELTQISDPDSSYRYTYDLDGRMETVSNQDTPSVPVTIMSYGYDNVGNVLSMTDEINGITGVSTTHQFDALNRLTQNAQGNKRVDYAYNALSQVTNKKRYSDTTGTNLVAETSHTYDSLDRLTDITHSKGANILANYTQAYDAKSRITGVTNGDGSSNFTYDNTDQLTGVDYNFQTDENYTYDDNGNRTNAGYVTGVNNRLLEDPKYRYDYDLVGNRTKRTDKSTNEVMEYSWDIRDRLTGLVVKNSLGDGNYST